MESSRQAIDELADHRPRVASVLSRAEAHREQEVRRWMTGLRLQGVEQLLGWLDTAGQVFSEVGNLRRVSFLIHRVTADIETALEATMSGYPSVAHDAMRDVMEIEFLLIDFTVDNDRMRQWVSASPDVVKRAFQPVHVRQRLASAGVLPSPDNVDYKAHSAALHVSPYRLPFAERGFSGSDPFAIDSCFWDMFEHARRVTRAIDGLARAHICDDDTKDPLPPWDSLHDVAVAWEKTQEMQAVFLALLEAARVTGDSDRDG